MSDDPNGEWAEVLESADKMFLYIPEFIPWAIASVKISEPVQPRPWYYLHQSSQMSLYGLDHEQIPMHNFYKVLIHEKQIWIIFKVWTSDSKGPQTK